MQECGELNASALSATHLVVVVPENPPEESCDMTPIASKPCDSTWIRQRYESKAWHSNVSHAPCDGCVAPTTTGTTTKVTATMTATTATTAVTTTTTAVTTITTTAVTTMTVTTTGSITTTITTTAVTTMTV